MKTSVWIIALIGVFLTATLVTAFALTLMTPDAPAGVGFVSRLLRNACAYGWAAGVAVTISFFFLRRSWMKKTRGPAP